jgi:hypothetical protein
MKVCVVGASGKLGRYLVQHALAHGYEVVAVCRPESIPKLEAYADRISIVPGRTDDRDAIGRAVAGCDGVLAVLDRAAPGTRLIFSCGWHISRDGEDSYSRAFRTKVAVFRWIGRTTRAADLDDQVEALRRVFASDTNWTVVRGSRLEEGESQGLPVWCRHVGDAPIARDRTRRTDFALFMVHALTNDALVHEAPAISAA